MAKMPRIPSTLVDLATPLSVDLEVGEVLKFPISGNWAMASTKNGNEIWILSRKNAKRVRATDAQGRRLYERFTGFEHDEVAKLIQAKPRSLKRIGRAVSITYRSDKFSANGNYSDYVHAFANYPTVSVDNQKNPSIVALRGGRIRIRKEGITG